jgi:hypothetical protein
MGSVKFTAAIIKSNALVRKPQVFRYCMSDDIGILPHICKQQQQHLEPYTCSCIC